MKKIFLAAFMVVNCASSIAQDQGRYNYTYTTPAEWMAMQIQLAMADDNSVTNNETLNGRVIEEVQINAPRVRDISKESNELLESMCLNLLAGRYDGLSGALAISAERIKMEYARENEIREQYLAYISKLSTEDARKVEDQKNSLVPQMVDTKIDWERYAREDTDLFFSEQTTICNQI